MDPVFTLPYTEFCIANYLNEKFKSKDGYSIYVPLSRQEKGVDLILAKRQGTDCSSISIQVKASRTYSPKPPKNKKIIRHIYYTWFNRYKIPEEADFFTLVGIYPPEENRTLKTRCHSWWSSIVLLFTQKEMKSFMSDVKTKKGKDDKMFGFGFDEPTEIYQTRGIQTGQEKNMTDYLIDKRLNILETLLENRLKK
jgi:hypothetical protein